MRREALALGTRAIHRVATSVAVVLISTLSTWTTQYVGIMQGICISGVIFIIATQLDQTAAHSKLLKRMCMLYCGQQTRGLFISNDYRPASLFTDILLAMGMAVITMVTYGENNPELKTLLDGLLFLYGDILDFAFQYGTFKVTLCAFGASMFLKYIEPPARHIAIFGWQMASIISANLLSEGMTYLIQTSPKLQLLQCIGCACILRLILPDMQTYLSYLAAQQLLTIQSGIAPMFFCILICLDVVPAGSRQWVDDVGCTYILLSLAAAVLTIPFWGMILVLVLAHYLEFIVSG